MRKERYGKYEGCVCHFSSESTILKLIKHENVQRII